MSMLMLSVSGCRGVVGETLTPEVAARFAGAFGAVLRERSKSGEGGGGGWAGGGEGAKPCVVLARDGRRGGQAMHSAATAGLLGSGCDVLDVGIAMTPTAAVITDEVARARSGVLVAGMVITASHNPQQWNGLKCLLREPAGLHDAGASAPPAALAHEIIARFHEGRSSSVTWERLGTLRSDADAAQTHIKRVMGAMEDAGLCAIASKLGEGTKVAVDCVNASSSATAPRFLRSLGCEVVAINTVLEGDQAGLFPHPPEPTMENLSGKGGLCDCVRAQGCQVGFALDPDADRLALIDEQGRYIGEEYTLALSAWAILGAGMRASGMKGVKGANGVDGGEHRVMVTNLSTSRMINDVAATFGARVLRTPVGEANVVEIMKREGAIAGGEGNGGTIWPRSCYVRDSLGAMALTLWLFKHAHDTSMGQRLGKSSARGHALSGLVSCVPAYSIEKRKVDLARKEDATAAVTKIAAFYGGAGQEVDLRDGAWVNFTKGQLANRAWLHVRASNTEPIMRLIAEAPSKAEAEGILAEAGRIIGT